MRINFYANVYLVKYALPLIKRTNGRIVVISSLSGKFGLPSRSAYCASKFALTGFFESLRTEEDLPILMVYPTSLETPMRSHSLIKSEKEGGEKNSLSKGWTRAERTSSCRGRPSWECCCSRYSRVSCGGRSSKLQNCDSAWLYLTIELLVWSSHIYFACRIW